jgi:hypothetical protein
MSFDRWLLIILISIAAAVQYGLAIYAIRDLIKRPSVRGDNKVAWGLVVLTCPFVGPLIYAYMGPTSFIPRPRHGVRRTVSPDVPVTLEDTSIG